MKLGAWSTVAVVTGLLVVTGCGGADQEASPERFTGVALEAQDPGPVHVHGLGYDAKQDVLYIATHTGMFELLADAAKARRIGDSYQDTMGFTLVSPELFLGSGHPDLREKLPSQLGLITSTDRGRSWDPVSLLGRTDFHVLQAQGRTVYGFDARSERLFASIDAGRSWKKLAPPEALIDLAIDPENPEHLLASGGAILYESANGGQTWEAVANGLAGHLAWPTSARAYLADAAGSVFAAPRASGPWRSRGVLDSPPAALLAVDARTLFAALHDGTIVRSGDGGATWKVRATP
ncbi:MAG: exo-alpha-sialidase [Actinobacteria bacterium]|nr:exo-alpha-sialidase [Actinomycetota bacterium]